MAANYKPADDEAREILIELLSEVFKEQEKTKVSYDLIFAYGPQDDVGALVGPAITHGGYTALGVAKILGLKDRVMGRGDCEIMLDGDRWPDLSREQKKALLDHEMTHIVLAKNQAGALLTDKLGRPKLKMRLHDRQFGWFDDVAVRNGEHSVEVQQGRELFQEMRQIYFPFATIMGDTVAPKRTRKQPNKP